MKANESLMRLKELRCLDWESRSVVEEAGLLFVSVLYLNFKMQLSSTTLQG